MITLCVMYLFSLFVCCSLVQLQEEKERQFHENRASFEEMVRSKDHEIHTLQNRVTTLTRDLENKNKVSETEFSIVLFF